MSTVHGSPKEVGVRTSLPVKVVGDAQEDTGRTSIAHRVPGSSTMPSHASAPIAKRAQAVPSFSSVTAIFPQDVLPLFVISKGRGKPRLLSHSLSNARGPIRREEPRCHQRVG